MSAFRDFLRSEGIASLDSYAALHAWSIDDSSAFWKAMWRFADVVGTPGSEPTAVVPGSPWMTRFFPDASMNVAATMLRDPTDDPALVVAREDGQRATLTRAELHALVSRVQQALRASGVTRGDRVAAWLPNASEVYALMLGAASIGAVFSSTSPDFGVDAVVDRFGQIEPTTLVAVDGYLYNGKRFDCIDRLHEIVRRLPSVTTVVVVDHLDSSATRDLPEGAMSWQSWIEPYDARPVELEPVSFDHPLYVLFSSGTTGPPKCIVHRGGGVLLKHLSEQQLQCDVQAGDRVLYFTTTGWMMWNWLASALASRACVVAYDGCPTFPSTTTLFDLVDEVDVTLLGISARYLDELRKSGVRPRETHELRSLRTIASTGSPLAADGFRYVYDDIKAELHLASISGGTDLCGCLVGGDPTSSVWPGEIQAPSPGVAVAVFDRDGVPLRPGERGELVCTNAFPSMPLGFWSDPDDVRLRAAYFARYPGIWHQSDFAQWTAHGGMIIHGRSDATLNPGGVRIGTAEITSVVDGIDDIAGSMVVGQEWEGDTRVVLFVTLRPGASFSDELQDEIRDRVRRGASPRHVPARIIAVPDLPRTRSNKLSELAVREVIHGRVPANVESLANPESLDFFRDLTELSR